MDILQKVGLLPGNQVLDIGFRDSARLKAIAEVVGSTGQVVGIDVDNRSVEQAKRELLEEPVTTIQIQQGSILSIPAPDNSFDVVLCQGVLHEVRELTRALKEMARVCRPDGVISILDFQPISPIHFAIYRLRHHLRSGTGCPDIHPGFSRKRLQELVSRAGLVEHTYEELQDTWRLGHIESAPLLMKVQPSEDIT